MTLSLLLIDSDDTHARALAEKLSGFARVAQAQGSDIVSAVEKESPDLIIIDRTSAMALFQRHHHIETELATARALLKERMLIERAKAILIKERKMTEPQAYRWLQKKAMNESRKLGQIVADFVATHEMPPREPPRR